MSQEDSPEDRQSYEFEALQASCLIKKFRKLITK